MINYKTYLVLNYMYQLIHTLFGGNYFFSNLWANGANFFSVVNTKENEQERQPIIKLIFNQINPIL